MLIKNVISHTKNHGFWSLIKVSGNYFLNRSGVGRFFVTVIESTSLMQAPKIAYTLSGVKFDQSWTKRKALMEKILIDHFVSSIKALEIGTWFGEGSTKIWIRQLPENSELYLIDSWRSYVSQSDKKKGWNSYTAMDYLSFSAIHNVLKNIRKIENQGKKSKITLIRGNGSEVLRNFKPELFDFIYIDGSHYYADVLQDIQVAKSLINKKFGIICGDDLEKYPTDKLIKFANEHLDEDFVDGFHPGVMKAVADQFEAVNMLDGFWWVFCVDGKFSIDRPMSNKPK